MNNKLSERVTDADGHPRAVKVVVWNVRVVQGPLHAGRQREALAYGDGERADDIEAFVRPCRVGIHLRLRGIVAGAPIGGRESRDPGPWGHDGERPLECLSQGRPNAIFLERIRTFRWRHCGHRLGPS